MTVYLTLNNEYFFHTTEIQRRRIFKDNQAINVPKAKDLCLKCEHKDRTRAKGVVMLDTGHHLTSHSTDMQKINERTRHYIFIHIYTYRFCVDYLRPSEIKLFLIGAIFELEPVFTFHHSATVGVD